MKITNDEYFVDKKLYPIKSITRHEPLCAEGIEMTRYYTKLNGKTIEICKNCMCDRNFSTFKKGDQKDLDLKSFCLVDENHLRELNDDSLSSPDKTTFFNPCMRICDYKVSKIQEAVDMFERINMTDTKEYRQAKKLIETRDWNSIKEVE